MGTDICFINGGRFEASVSVSPGVGIIGVDLDFLIEFSEVFKSEEINFVSISVDDRIS